MDINIILIVVAALAGLVAIFSAVMFFLPAKDKNYNASNNGTMAYPHGPTSVHVGMPPQQPVAQAFQQPPQPVAPVFQQPPQRPAAPVFEQPAPQEPAFGARVDFSGNDNSAPAAGFGGFSSAPMEEARAVPVAHTVKDDTTVLMPPDDATELLSAYTQRVVLHRTRTGEQVVIESEEFLIGRASSGVDYRIADNNSISRVHVKIILRDGLAYMMDMNAANGTSLNHKRVTPMQEYLLHDGDVITLANEEFVYRV